MEVIYKPRISFRNQTNFKNAAEVKVAGVVLKIDSSRAIIETCDKGQIQVNLTPDSRIHNAQPGAIVEVTGKFDSDNTIAELASVVFESDSFDADNYASLLKVIDKYPLQFHE